MKPRYAIIIDGKAYQMELDAVKTDTGIQFLRRLVPVNIELVGSKEDWVQHNGHIFAIYEGGEPLDG